MFFPLFFIIKSKKTPKVVSGEYYTAEWWAQRCGFNTNSKAAARLTRLAREGIVQKVSVGKYEIVRFMPTASFCENDIVTLLQKPLDKS